ncbi:MAG: hypothetical protein LW875_03625 [Proteobacteria bacterium]|jgi:hypothetical protein|nr:hypothetical protein [Pseudomonadota bacterium]
MKKLIFLLLFIPVVGFATEKISLEGTLFKKDGKWHLFVESDNSSIKKGVIALIKIPKSQMKLLGEKYFVVVAGYQEKCESQHICLAVEKIKPAVNDPLKDRK